jgi:hypothetical protein
VRPVADVEADIAKLLANNPKAGDCRVMNGPVSRAICPQVATLNGEIARTRRRAELQGDIANLTGAMPAAVGTADPASSAISAYFAVLLGVHLPATAIAQWLVLVPVLALELGAALAMVLVEAIALPDKADDSQPVDRSDEQLVPVAYSLSGHPAKDRGRVRGRRTGKKQPVRANAAVQTRILDAIKAKGGRLEAGSVRTIAQLVGGRKSTVHAALGMLIAAGAVAKAGKALVLANGG